MMVRWHTSTVTNRRSMTSSSYAQLCSSRHGEEPPTRCHMCVAEVVEPHRSWVLPRSAQWLVDSQKQVTRDDNTVTDGTMPAS